MTAGFPAGGEKHRTGLPAVPGEKTETLKSALKKGTDVLRQAGIADADLDAWYLLEYVTGTDRAHYLADPDCIMAEEDKEKYKSCISRRAGRVPLQHITGEQEFMGLSFHVSEHVLIPRQDTEILVEQALGLLKQGEVPVGGPAPFTGRILDLCTGSGCILISILHWAQTALEGVGSDISREALEVAQENARNLGQKNAEFICSDLFEKISGTFGMIVSNPPYIRSAEIRTLEDEVKLHDPLLALDGKEDGLYFYRRITDEAGDYLEPGGYLLFETGCDQAQDVKSLMEKAGFEETAVVKDLAGLDRVVLGRMPYR